MLAARANGGRERPEVVGDEHDHRVRRRLLQILEEGIGSVLVQEVGAEHE